jgi:hypothetical protein
MTALAAVDLGASSGRVIVGRVGPDHLSMNEVHRFRNGPVRLPDGLYWDVLGLYTDILNQLRRRPRPALAGLAIGCGRWTTAFSTPAGRWATRGTTRPARAVVDGVHPGSTPPGSTPLRACGSRRSAPSTSSPPGPAGRPEERC